MGIAELFSKFVKSDCHGGGWDIPLDTGLHLV